MQREPSDEDNTNEKLKRFDDIFRMSLLAITVMITVASITFGTINLLNAYWFILSSLILWMAGHAVGAKGYRFTHIELDMKIYAWVLAMLFGAMAATKIALRIIYLEPPTLLVIIPFFLILALPPYFCFKKELGEFGSKRLTKFIERLLLILTVGVCLGYLYI